MPGPGTGRRSDRFNTQAPEALSTSTPLTTHASNKRTLEGDGERRRDELRDAGDEHDLADLERAVPAHEGEKHRHQVDGAEEPDAEHKAQEAADREAAVAERRK